MISRFVLNSSVALAGVALNDAGSAGSVADTLQQVDTVLFIVGLGLLAVLGIWGVWRMVHRKSTPFPARENSMTPELILLPVAAYLMVYYLSWPIIEPLAKADASEGARLAANSIGMIAAMIACIWAGQCFFTGGARQFVIGGSQIGRRLGQAILCLLISLPLCAIVHDATIAAFQYWQPAYEPIEHDVINALRDGNEPPWAFITLWAGAVLIAPVAEECFFRGLLQTVLRDVTRRPAVAIVVTGVLFGLAHNDQWHVVPAIAVFGIALGWLYERSGSLLGPMVLHCLFNLRTMTWEALGAGS